MIKKIFFFVLISLFTFGCNTEKEKPENLIGQEEMILVIKDLMLLEATYNTQLTGLKDKNERMISYNEEIFTKHNISKEDFDQSYQYYIENPEEFEAMLELVFEELTKMETEAEKYKEAKKSENDSLRSSR